MRKLVAALAVRNNGSRLYGKPLQNIDIVSQYKVLDLIVDTLKSINSIDRICLAISEGEENILYKNYAIKNELDFIIGSEKDVLSRLIKCSHHTLATDIFRVTTESPFISYELIDEVWHTHVRNENDATFYDNVVDGCGFEIISSKALIRSHNEGEERHRSELCTLFIRENKDKFKIGYEIPDFKLIRNDLRLTIDNPEDLIVCREIYGHFKKNEKKFNLPEIIDFLDQNEFLKNLTYKYTIDGYSTMYL